MHYQRNALQFSLYCTLQKCTLQQSAENRVTSHQAKRAFYWVKKVEEPSNHQLTIIQQLLYIIIITSLSSIENSSFQRWKWNLATKTRKGSWSRHSLGSLKVLDGQLNIL